MPLRVAQQLEAGLEHLAHQTLLAPERALVALHARQQVEQHAATLAVAEQPAGQRGRGHDGRILPRTRAGCEPRPARRVALRSPRGGVPAWGLERWWWNRGLPPRGQRFELPVPAPDLAVPAQRIAANLRAGQPAPDGEVGEGHAVADQPAPTAQMPVEYLRNDVELLLAARDLLRIRVALSEATLHEMLVDQARGCIRTIRGSRGLRAGATGPILAACRHRGTCCEPSGTSCASSSSSAPS